MLNDSSAYKPSFDDSLLQEEIIRLLVCRYAPTLRTLFTIVMNFGSPKIGRIHLDN
jgi:hypothetical protein